MRLVLIIIAIVFGVGRTIRRAFRGIEFETLHDVYSTDDQLALRADVRVKGSNGVRWSDVSREIHGRGAA